MPSSLSRYFYLEKKLAHREQTCVELLRLSSRIQIQEKKKKKKQETETSHKYIELLSLHYLLFVRTINDKIYNHSAESIKCFVTRINRGKKGGSRKQNVMKKGVNIERRVGIEVGNRESEHGQEIH